MRLYILLAILLMITACSSNKLSNTEKSKIPIYAWNRGFSNPSVAELQARFLDMKKKGIDGIIYSAGKDPERYRRAGKIAKELKLHFQALLPAMIHHPNGQLDSASYVVNGLGQSAYDAPCFPRNNFLCPNREEVYEHVEKMYAKIADIPEVDGIQLDAIRYPDVILAPALWEKYNLVMDREYPKYDYCYCDKCVADFEEASGINIKAIKDPSTIKSWKQFRYDRLTDLVNRLTKMVHAKGKLITAAVFPGPHSVAKKIVRQEWNKWEVDAFFPMNYNDFYLEDTEWIGAVSEEARAAVGNRKAIFSGLFICPNPANKAKEKNPEYYGLLPEELEAAIENSIENGATGICLFTYGRMKEAHWKVLSESINSSLDNGL